MEPIFAQTPSAAQARSKIIGLKRPRHGESKRLGKQTEHLLGISYPNQDVVNTSKYAAGPGELEQKPALRV